MRAWVAPIALILIAVFLFFGFIDPTYSDVQGLQTEIAQFDEALEKSKELQAIRDELLSKYNTFSSSDIERLEKMLPDNVNNVRLILDIDGIAGTYGLSIRNISVSERGVNGEEVVGPDNRAYGSVELGFTVSGGYRDFANFIKDLEKSLRLVDISGISFSTIGSEVDFYDYTVGVRTYWLK